MATTTMAQHDEWYKDWFNSPYYHILYQNRDKQEASRFIDNLLAYLQPGRDACFLDLACGKGRHAYELAQKGYWVIGVDIGHENVHEANRFQTNNLSFFVWDMRKPVRENYFDYVLNLFTSFGYFDDQGNVETLEAVKSSLNEGGTCVIDYLNTAKAARTLKPEEEITLDGITFHLKRQLRGDVITKTITVMDQGIEHVFQESIKALQLDDFTNYFQKTGLEFIDHFGDYNLSPFEESSSDRLILIARKP